MYPTDRDFLDIERLYTEDNINAVKEIFDIQVSHLESLLDVLKPARVYIVPPLPRQHKDIYKYYEKYNAAAYLLTLLMQDKLHNQIINKCLIKTIQLEQFKDIWSMSSGERSLIYHEFKNTNNDKGVHFVEGEYELMYKEIIFQIRRDITSQTHQSPTPQPLKPQPSKPQPPPSQLPTTQPPPSQLPTTQPPPSQPPPSQLPSRQPSPSQPPPSQSPALDQQTPQQPTPPPPPTEDDTMLQYPKLPELKGPASFYNLWVNTHESEPGN